MKKHLLICLTLSGGLLTTCSKGPVDGNDGDPTAAGCPVIEEFVDMAIQIKEPTTWTADKVYLFRRAIVEVESELTIEPGTVMKFDGSSITVRPGQHGKIIANGTTDKRIVFTSYADNTHCGNTQAEGGDAQPERGDWGGIYIDGGNNHSFVYTDFLYAGGPFGDGSMSSAVELTSNVGDTFTFDHCVFAHTFSDQRVDIGGPGIHAAFMATFIQDRPNPEVIRFTNNAFYDNDKPIMINAHIPVDASNKFHNPRNPAEGNDRNFIHLFEWSHQEGDMTWAHTEVPYVYTGGTGSRIAKSSHTVTIGPNVVVKIPGPAGGINGYDDIRVINLHSEAILTSYYDDAHGGDSNGDGADTSPAKGDWAGFVIRMPGQAKDIWMKGDNILYSRF